MKKAASIVGSVLLAGAVYLGVNARRPDKIAPVITISAPAAGVTVSGLVAVKISTTDNVGANHLVVAVDGIPLCDLKKSPFKQAEWVCPWQSADSDVERPRNLVAIAYDGAGNQAQQSVQVTSAAIFRIVTTSVPEGLCGQPYRAVLTAIGGIKPYSWGTELWNMPPYFTFTVEGNDAIISGQVPPVGADGTCGGSANASGRPGTFELAMTEITTPRTLGLRSWLQNRLHLP